MPRLQLAASVNQAALLQISVQEEAVQPPSPPPLISQLLPTCWLLFGFSPAAHDFPIV